MITPKYTLRPAQPAEAPILGDLLYNSKLSLSVNRLLFNNWPNEEAQRKNYTAVFHKLDSSPTEALVVCDAASGEVIGHLALTRKRPTTDTSQLTSPPAKVPAGEKPEPEAEEIFNQEVLGAIIETVEELTGDAKGLDHYELTFIVLRPGYRHQGIGRELVQHAFNKAKAAGIPLRVSAEPQVYNFFVNCGFKPIKHVDIDLAQWAPPNSGYGTFRLASLVWNPED